MSAMCRALSRISFVEVSATLRPVPDRTNIRIGLAIITVVVLAAVVLVFVVDSAVARATMVAVALVGFVRLFLLFRSLRSAPPA